MPITPHRLGYNPFDYGWLWHTMPIYIGPIGNRDNPSDRLAKWELMFSSAWEFGVPCFETTPVTMGGLSGRTNLSTKSYQVHVCSEKTVDMWRLSCHSISYYGYPWIQAASHTTPWSCLVYICVPCLHRMEFSNNGSTTARVEAPQLDPKMVSRGHLTWPLKGCVMVETWYMGNGHCHQLGILMIHYDGYSGPIVSLLMDSWPSPQTGKFAHVLSMAHVDIVGTVEEATWGNDNRLLKALLILISFKVQLQLQSNWRTEGWSSRRMHLGVTPP